MTDDLERKLQEEYERSHQLALRQFRKDVAAFKERRRIELEDLLKTELDKPEDLRDEEKIRWLQEELKNIS